VWVVPDTEFVDASVIADGVPSATAPEVVIVVKSIPAPEEIDVTDPDPTPRSTHAEPLCILSTLEVVLYTTMPAGPVMASLWVSVILGNRSPLVVLLISNAALAFFKGDPTPS